MNILAPTDFSKQSELGLAAAMAWFGTEVSIVHLLHVVPTWLWPMLEAERSREMLFEDAESRLHDLEALWTTEQIRVESHVVEGVPYIEIARFAEALEVDLAVLATHGHSRLKRFLLGSTTETVVRSVSSSVLVARAAPAGGAEFRPLGKILAVTDFSSHSEQALDRAIEIASRTEAEIVLLHVMRAADHPFREVLSPKLWGDVRRRCEHRLRRLHGSRVSDAVRSRTLVEDGIPSAKIADVAAAQGVDLVVIGSHGSTAPDRRPGLGSTAERVVRAAPCSVLVVR